MGILSLLIGVAVWLSMIALCLYSYAAGGSAGIVLGVLGILTFAAAIVGFVFAVKCYKKEDIYVITPVIGCALNSTMIIICVILYVLGAV